MSTSFYEIFNKIKIFMKTPIYILAKDKLKVLLLLCIAKKEMYLIPISVDNSGN